MKILLVGLAVNVPLNLVLIPLFGASGSALAVGLSWIPVWYLSERKCSAYPSEFEKIHWIKNLAWIALPNASLFALRHNWHPAGLGERGESAFWLFLACVTNIIAFALANRHEAKEIVGELKSMFSKKKRPYPITVPENGEFTN